MSGTTSEGKPLDIISAFQAYGKSHRTWLLSVGSEWTLSADNEPPVGEYVSGKISDEERLNIVSGANSEPTVRELCGGLGSE